MKTSAIFLVAILAFAVFAASDAQAVADAKHQTAAAADEAKKGAVAAGAGAVGVVKGAGNTVGAAVKTGAEKVNNATRPITAPIVGAAKNVSGVVAHGTKAAVSSVGQYTSNVGNAIAGKPSKP